MKTNQGRTQKRRLIVKMSIYNISLAVLMLIQFQHIDQVTAERLKSSSGSNEQIEGMEQVEQAKVAQLYGDDIKTQTAAGYTTDSFQSQSQLPIKTGNGLTGNGSSSLPLLNLDIFEASRLNFFRHSVEVSVIICAAYTIVFIVGLVGNSFVVAIVCKSPRMRTVTNYFIANLALADILVLVLCLPATLVSNLYIPYVLGLFVCKTVSYLQGVSVSASINTMVAVTIDRFLAICFPMDWHMSRRIARWTIAGIWLFSLSISLPWAIYFDLFEYDYGDVKLYMCNEKWPDERLGRIYFVCANLILLYVLPGALIMLCYLGIWYKIERRNIPGDRPKGLKIELIMQRSKIKVVKMMMVVVVIFLLSWLPLYLIFARIKLGENRSQTEDWLIAKLMPLAQWLGASNSCINPILYTFFNRKYKRGFIELLTFGLCCRSASNATSIVGQPELNGRGSRQSDVAITFAAQTASTGLNLARQRASEGCMMRKANSGKNSSSSIVANGSRANLFDDIRQLESSAYRARNTSEETHLGRKSVSNSGVSSSTESSRPSGTERDLISYSSISVDNHRIRSEVGGINKQLLPCRDTNTNSKKQKQTQPSLIISGKKRLFDHVAGRDSLLIREIRYFRRGLRFDEAKRRQEKLVSNMSNSSSSQQPSGSNQSAHLETLNGKSSKDREGKTEANRDRNDATGKTARAEENPMELSTTPKATRKKNKKGKFSCRYSGNRSLRSNSTTESTDITLISSTLNSGNGNGGSQTSTKAFESNQRNLLTDHDVNQLIVQDLSPLTCSNMRLEVRRNTGGSTSSDGSSIHDEEGDTEICQDTKELDWDSNLARSTTETDTSKMSVKRQSRPKRRNPIGLIQEEATSDNRTRVLKVQTKAEHEESDDEDDDNLLFGSLHNTPEKKPKPSNEFHLKEITKSVSHSSNPINFIQEPQSFGSSLVQVKICDSTSSHEDSRSVDGNFAGTTNEDSRARIMRVEQVTSDLMLESVTQVCDTKQRNYHSSGGQEEESKRWKKEKETQSSNQARL